MASKHGEPQSPNEAILQNMLGENNVLREPQSRIEALLIELLGVLEGGGMVLPSADGDYILHVENGVAAWVETNALEVQNEE